MTNQKPIARYIQQKNFKLQRLWKLKAGIWRTKIGGRNLTESQFDERFPRFNPLLFTLDPNNLDAKHNYVK